MSNATLKKLSTLTHVPDDRLEEIIEDFKSEGATVSKRRHADGTWSVTGTFETDLDSELDAEED